MGEKYKRHKEICEELNEIYIAKNTAYNDSFGKTVMKKGIIAAVTRMEDKWTRFEALAFEALASGVQNDVYDESIIDTLNDLANYAIMTRIELERMKKND